MSSSCWIFLLESVMESGYVSKCNPYRWALIREYKKMFSPVHRSSPPVQSQQSTTGPVHQSSLPVQSTCPVHVDYLLNQWNSYSRLALCGAHRAEASLKDPAVLQREVGGNWISADSVRLLWRTPLLWYRCYGYNSTRSARMHRVLSKIIVPRSRCVRYVTTT